MKQTSKPPIKLKDMTRYYVHDKVAKAADYNNSPVNNKPIQHVQAVGKEVYFTKFNFQSMYAGACGGGGADILEIYKKASNRKISKVVNDKVSSDSYHAFVISSKSLYYAKVVNKALGNFTIIQSDLNGKSKKTLQKGVDDVWLNKNKIYYVKNEKLYRMDLNGKNIKSLNVKTKLYGNTGCGEGNYSVSNNGLNITDYSGDAIKDSFFDFSTSSTSKVVNKADYIVDVDTKKKRVVAESFDGDKRVYSVYDSKGKLIKKLKSFSWFDGPQLHSVDAKKGQLLYIEGTKLKQIKF